MTYSKIAIMVCLSAFWLPQAALAESKICEPAQREFAAKPGAFDFLVGAWEVLEGDTVVARVEVHPIMDDKVLELTWKSTTTSTYEGRAFLGMDQNGRWSQTWVDSSSTPFFLFYHGGVEDGVPTLYQTEMYHESEMFGIEGRSGYVCPRQRFSLQDEGTFLYTFELSTDQGKSWGVQDTLTFRRR